MSLAALGLLAWLHFQAANGGTFALLPDRPGAQEAWDELVDNGMIRIDHEDPTSVVLL